MTSQVTSYRWCPCYLADYVDTGVHKSFFGGGIPRSNDARCSVCMKQCVCETFVAVNVPTGSRGGDVAVYVFDVNQPSLPTPFHSVLVSISVFTALSTVFHSVNSPDNSPLSHSVPPVSFLPHWSFQLSIFMKVSFSPDIIRSG